MSLDTLRALALSYRPEQHYSVCLDRDLQIERVMLMREITATQAELDRLDQPAPDARPRQSVGEKPAQQVLAAKIEQLTADLEALDERARPKSVSLFFSRLPITDDGADEGQESYEHVVNRFTDENDRVNTDKLASALLPLTYLRTEAVDGGNLNLTWKQIAATLGRADIELLRHMILGHHEAGSAVPFDPRTSGLPETA